MQAIILLLILVPAPKEPPCLIGEFSVKWGSLDYWCEFKRDGTYDSSEPWRDGTWTQRGDTIEFHDRIGVWTIHIDDWTDLTGDGRRFYGPDAQVTEPVKVQLKRSPPIPREVAR